jgi:protein ImuB
MRRVIPVFLPTWTTDLLRRQPGAGAPPVDRPLVTTIVDGQRRVVAAAGCPALSLGLALGMAIAQAQAVVPGLMVVEDRLIPAETWKQQHGWFIRDLDVPAFVQA